MTTLPELAKLLEAWLADPNDNADEICPLIESMPKLLAVVEAAQHVVDSPDPLDLGQLQRALAALKEPA